MIKSSEQCRNLKTNTEKSWFYHQYYCGEEDTEQRKNVQGENHWSGAKSLEWYCGHFMRDTMHGEGDYHWRYRGPNGAFVSYEGHFFNNEIHGYGAMSYADGRVFNGIFHGNLRWGPGIESHALLKEDVGLWSGTQLIRLCWLPEGPDVAPDFLSSFLGREVVNPHRKILKSSTKIIGEVNSALELLKHYGANPVTAIDKWNKIYPQHCTDLSSALCHVDMFENDYYKGKIYTLQEKLNDKSENDENEISEDSQEIGIFFAWNNNDTIQHIMKHCYKHERQRENSGLDLTSILSGPRTLFKPAGLHEIYCRTLLMASYLGHISHVAQLINESKIHPDVSDMQGNTPLMYATCGGQFDIIHFLVEAGANINSYNDSCCTPLGMALIKFACTQKDIGPSGFLQMLLPPYISGPRTPTEQQVLEWKISRDSQASGGTGALNKSSSKTNRNASSKRIKSVMSLKDQTPGKKKTNEPPKIPEQTSDESFSEDKRLYNKVKREYSIKINEAYQIINTNPIPYLFEVNDMIKEVDALEEEHKKLPEKNPKKVISKVLKEATKPSKDAMWQGDREDSKSISSVEKQKRDMLSRMSSTIFQLLSDGADPKLVKFPQPALALAITSGCSEIVRHLICHGADICEGYPEILGYVALDMAISLPFMNDHLDIIRVLLEHGADTQHRLVYTNELSSEISGPTLLHAVLARRTENEYEEEIRRQIIELLLDHNCNPTAQFKGKSAIDISMSKNIDVFDIFVKSSKTNLNLIINDLNQSVLVKMFYLPFFKTIGGTERLQMITNLLLFGANPLIECHNGDETYRNIFAFAKKTLCDLEGTQIKTTSPIGDYANKLVDSSAKQDQKVKKLEKPKKEDKMSTKSMGKMADDLGEYKQALELVTECARLLHIRWLQAKLIKELIHTINMHRHRHWNMILKEQKRKKNIGLWVSPQRCLEIWNILAANKKKVLADRRILKHLLCIVQCCYNRTLNNMSCNAPVTAVEKGLIEYDVSYLLHDHQDTESLTSEVLWKRCYVKPEVMTNAANIFNVCFECALPMEENTFICISCKMISFCSLDCMKLNIERINCHPCRNVLKEKYFPDYSNSFGQDI